MRPSSSYVLLFALLVLSISITSLALEGQWPYNLSPDIKYYPEDEPMVQRTVEIQKRLVNQKPVAVCKMSEDEGEMFFLDYWQFDRTEDTLRADDPYQSIREGSAMLDPQMNVKEKSQIDRMANASMSIYYLPPVLLHAEQPTTPNPLFRRLLRTPLARLDRRDFVCPSGTSSCASIGQPNICCPTEDTCQLVSGSALGNVGCCASGQQCSGAVQNCQTGYTPCPGSSGGGMFNRTTTC